LELFLVNGILEIFFAWKSVVLFSIGMLFCAIELVWHFGNACFF